ncbi:probable serine/threonine-protein kinase DDB_G0282963 [Microplitis mediator]|uniref:probable serine/threonine-protein kinase DDB_G0282963 n=1 Tax=Microplitis mediator TaxID=375433 RepID=UPI0025527CD9|nr:probable serine/threonine-protein kinase DDB_G0282963 [Microplitis mediator]
MEIMDSSVKVVKGRQLNSPPDADNCKIMATIFENQPWISKFKSMCLMDNSGSSSLISLMEYFIRNVQPTVNECQTKPLRADKLKGFISETLLFFMYYYRSQEENYDRAIYMDLMSDLLAMYIDLELKASKRTCEYHERISGRLASYLYIYLENSTEHLMDTILKIRFMSSTYYQIINPIMTTIFRIVPKHPQSCLMYTRYFLVYRIWKRITKDQNIKNEINAKALASLKLPSTSFPQYIIDHVLPKVPNTQQEISTKSMLSQHMELEKSCSAFIKFSRELRGLKDNDIDDTRLDDTVEALKPEDNLISKLQLSKENSIKNNNLFLNSSSSNSINNNNYNNNSESKVTINNNNNNNDNNSTANIINPICSKPTSRKPIKKNNNVVLIDLTSDDTNVKVIKQKKQEQKRLSWLQKISKRKSIATTEDSNISEDDKTTTEDSLQQLEDIFGIKSFTVDTDNKRVEEEIKVEMKILPSTSSAEISRNNPVNLIEDDEEVCMISNKLFASKINNINFHVETNESQLCKNNLTIEPVDGSKEELIINDNEIVVEENVKLSSPMIVNDEYEQVTIEKNIPSVEENIIDVTKNNVSVSENEYLDKRPYNENINKKADEGKITSQSNFKFKSTNLDVNEYQRNTVLHFNQSTEFVDFNNKDTGEEGKEKEEKDNVTGEKVAAFKISDAEFHEHIDGLSLLASVSQRVSHLTAASNEPTKSRELIKVKDYNSLITSCDTTKQNRTISNNNNHSEVLLTNEDNRFVSIYPDDDIDKVALHVEVSSTEDFNYNFPKSEYQETSSSSSPFLSSTSYSYSSNININSNERSNGLTSTSVQVESTIPSDKEETNVILNGETIVLLQKSPNSNLYIINKAVENKDHNINNDDEEILKDKNSTKLSDKVTHDSYSRELYDSYRITQPLSSVTSKSFELTQDIRRTTKAEPVSEVKALDLKKKSMKKNSCSDIKGVSTTGRCRIKQEFNACANDITNHMSNSSYAQTCSQDHDPRIHLAGSNPLPAMYHHSNYTTGDLYISCRQNCNSVCVPVNHQTAASIHGNPKSTRCTCLNCTYDIVTHCNQYIMPAGDVVTETSSGIDPAAYYIPIQQPSVLQDRSLNKTHEDNKIKMYDSQLLCKLEAAIDDERQHHHQKHQQTKQPQPQQQTKIYSPDVNIKLPLKKRFKSIIAPDFDTASIKMEKVDNNFIDRSIISMSALGAHSTDNLIKHKINGNNIMQRDYDKNLINNNGYHNYSDTRKRKPHANNVIIYTNNNNDNNNNNDDDDEDYEDYGTDNNYKKMNEEIMRPLKKIKEPKSINKNLNSVRKTRSSQRKVPKINYSCMDDDLEINPSVEVKRKRRKTSR